MTNDVVRIRSDMSRKQKTPTTTTTTTTIITITATTPSSSSSSNSSNSSRTAAAGKSMKMGVGRWELGVGRWATMFRLVWLTAACAPRFPGFPVVGHNMRPAISWVSFGRPPHTPRDFMGFVWLAAARAPRSPGFRVVGKRVHPHTPKLCKNMVRVPSIH